MLSVNGRKLSRDNTTWLKRCGILKRAMRCSHEGKGRADLRQQLFWVKRRLKLNLRMSLRLSHAVVPSSYDITFPLEQQPQEMRASPLVQWGCDIRRRKFLTSTFVAFDVWVESRWERRRYQGPKDLTELTAGKLQILYLFHLCIVFWRFERLGAR